MNSILENAELTLETARDKAKRNVLIKEILENAEFVNWTHSFVLRNGGGQDDVQTVINDTVLNFIKVCLNPDFQLKTVQGYLKGSAKNIWYQIFRKRKVYTSMDVVGDKGEEENITLGLIQKEKKKLLNILLDKIGEDCKDILTLWAYNMRMREIANQLNFSSEGYVKKRKHICLKRLIKVSQDHPEILSELKLHG